MASRLPFLHSPAVPSPENPLAMFHFPAKIFLLSLLTPTRRTLLSANNRNQTPFLSPQKNPGLIRSSVTVRSNLILNFPLISPTDPWGMWTALFATGAVGIWSERTKIGSALSGALVSTLVGLAASNLRIISCESPAYSIVLKFLLPLAVPLLLFRADLRRVIQSTGTLLLAFLLGSVATTVGTVLAYMMVPMRALGQDSWKIAAALMGRHIGGAVNYVAISDALGVSPSILAAGLAADNVICAVYFTSLFALASKIPAESSASTDGAGMDSGSESGNKLPVLQTATALAVSFAICKAGEYVTKFFAIPGGILPVVTAIVVILATAFPTQFNHLAPSGRGFGPDSDAGIFCCGWCKWKRMECDQYCAQHFHVCFGPDWHSSCCDPWTWKAISLRPKAVANCIKC
ncbi:hypothetical protein OIU76_029453 [Salix suchowensis]|nr:hypothetical protein OIU76_029453 [Salix suchowensis]